MGLILGVDGGGSKTLLALATRGGDIVSVERGASMDPAAHPDWALLLRDMMVASRAPTQEIEAAVFGLSSFGEIAAQSDHQKSVVAALAGDEALVENDVRIAFDGALAGAGGVLLLAGTGSMAWASAGGPDARQVRIGGWGEAFGDEGSAFWIGREALGLATRALDGRSDALPFAAALLDNLAIGPDDLLFWAAALENRRAGFASLARIVSALCETCDPDASRLIHAAAAHLSDHAGAAWRMVGTDQPLRWSYAGGVFASPTFLAAVTADLGIAPVPPRLSPVGGALLRAAERAGWPVNDAWIDRLSASLAHHPVSSPQP
ncbi:N-acetylglucosamine kinase [Aureimonas sp. SA4125]|uniref:N-acetylglucosamine kinase n=1 Tax=Aureimonas sp. SA4125 TaxID=2826993 RepID=UPI001CC5C139|nr:BadF/BadG/BcrA/BcrD ATPase family protein [Aureimonas sp. SA4125]BDA84434.1 N-acetylglucosamine kinase [Aureimonas sp. SA4125]